MRGPHGSRSLNIAVRNNRGSVSHGTHVFYWTLSFSSIVLRFFPITRTSFPTESGVLDRHAEQHVLVLLGSRRQTRLGGEYTFGVVGAHSHEVGELLPDGRDEAGLSLHPFVVGHRPLLSHDQIETSSRTVENSLLSSPTEGDQWRIYQGA
jgi:hypothetical protein